MKYEVEQPEPAGGLEFSGKEEIYDDGIFRISLPAELITQIGDDSLCFGLDGLPIRVIWTTLFAERSELEQLDCPTETLEGVMRFFLPDLLPEEIERPVFLTNGFYRMSHGSVRDGKCRSCCLLTNFAEEDAVVMASLEVIAPEDWQDDLRRVGLLHLLKRSVRSAQCTIGEPRINTSRSFLNIPKIGIRFPTMLASMSYDFATDYESQGPGEGESLRYSDEDGRKGDIYIYDSGEELIEPGTETELVREQMADAISCIESTYESAVSEPLEEIVTSFGREEMAFLVRWILLVDPETGEISWVTAILLAARKGVFIKVRFTPLPSETEVPHPLLERFMNDLADVLTA